MRRTSIAVLTAVLLLTAACGEEAKEGPLEVSDDSRASQAPSPEASGTDDAVGQEKFDAEGHEALRGSSDAETPEEEAVVDAWFAYWEARARSFGEARVDPELGSVAAADAVSDVVRYVAYLRSKELTTVGDTRFDVRDVEVQGSSATLSGCAENKSIDRSADGTPAEQPIAFFASEGTLVKRAGTWRVVSAPIRTSDSPC